MRALLLSILLALALPSVAGAAVQQLPEAPYPCSGPCHAQDTPDPNDLSVSGVGGVTISPPAINVGQNLTVTYNWYAPGTGGVPEWRPTSFAPIGVPQGGDCAAPPPLAGTWTCTVKMNSATNGWARHNVGFCCFNAHAEAAYAVIGEGKIINGTVLERDPRQPSRLVGADRIDVVATIGGQVFRTNTSPTGTYTLVVEEGSGSISTAGGHCVRDRLPDCVTSKSITMGPNTIVDFEQPPRYRITGTVKNNAGQPVRRVTVRADGPDGRVASDSSNSDGEYTMEVPEGAFTLRSDDRDVCVIVGGDCPQTRSVSVSADTTQDFRKRDLVTVSGRVTEGNNRRGAFGVRVRGGGETATTLRDGSYELRIPRGTASDRVNVQAGETGAVYRVAQGSDCRAAERGCDVIPSEDRHVDFHRIADPRFEWNVASECSSPDDGCDGAHLEIQLDGSSSEAAPGRRIVSWDWDVGGQRLSGERPMARMGNSAPVRVTLTTRDDQGNQTSTFRVIDKCDGNSDDAPIASTRVAIGPCFGLRVRLLGRRMTNDLVLVTLIVNNDGTDAIQGLEFSGDHGIDVGRGGTSIARRVGGPSAPLPVTLAPGQAEERRYAFKLFRPGTLQVVAAASGRSATGREMTASSVLHLRVRNIDPPDPQERRMNENAMFSDFAAKHIETVQRRAEQVESANGRALARELSRNGRSTTSDREAMVAGMLHKGQDQFAWLEEASSALRGPNGERYSTTEMLELYLAGATSRGALDAAGRNVRAAATDLAMVPDQIVGAVAGPERDYLTRLAGVMMNARNPNALRHLSSELESAQRQYLSDATRRADTLDWLGMYQASVQMSAGTMTPQEAQQFVAQKAASHLTNGLALVDSAGQALRSATAQGLENLHNDPAGFITKLGERSTGLAAYMATDAVLTATGGGALKKISEAGRLGTTVNRLEDAADTLGDTLETATDYTRMDDLATAELPPLPNRPLNGLVGWERSGYDDNLLGSLTASVKETEKAIGSAERGKELVLVARDGNPHALQRYQQGVNAPKSELLAQKTGKEHDLRFGMSEDALGLSTLYRPSQPRGLAGLVQRFVPESADDFKRRALRFAEYDQFFTPGQATRTGNRALDAKIAALRSDLAGKMDMLREALSPTGIERVDNYGNVTRLKVTAERTADGRSVVFKTDRYEYGRYDRSGVFRGRQMARPGTYQGLDVDLTHFLERDLATGQLSKLPAGLKSKAQLTLYDEAGKRGVPLSEHRHSFESPDLSSRNAATGLLDPEKGAKASKVSLQYSLDQLSKSDQRRYVQQHRDEIMRRMNLNPRSAADREKLAKWVEELDADQFRLEITSGGAQRGGRFIPR